MTPVQSTGERWEEGWEGDSTVQLIEASSHLRLSDQTLLTIEGCLEPVLGFS